MKTRASNHPNILEKVLVFALVAFVLFFLLIFGIDAFLLHPIPAPEGHFSVTGGVPLAINEPIQRDPLYADAVVVDRSSASHWITVYLVESQGQLRLLEYRTHFLSARSVRCADVAVADDGVYENGPVLGRYTVTVQDRQIANVHANAAIAPGKLSMSIYITLSVLLTLVCSLIYRKILLRKAAQR